MQADAVLYVVDPQVGGVPATDKEYLQRLKGDVSQRLMLVRLTALSNPGLWGYAPLNMCVACIVSTLRLAGCDQDGQVLRSP